MRLERVRRRAGAPGLVLALAAASAVVPGCGAQAQDGLTVFAAASLRDVVGGLETAWLHDHPQAPLTVAYEASNVLAAQIAEGAAVDVFLSADTRRPAELVEAGHGHGPVRTFAHNHLTIVTPAEGGLSAALDLARPGTRVVATARGVPISAYAAEALAELAATTPDPAVFARAVEANVVSREDNVRAALAKVELGEADAAIVYDTDAASSEHVRELPFPPGVEVVAEYAAVAVSARATAAEFVEWLGGEVAAVALREAGFEAASP